MGDRDVSNNDKRLRRYKHRKFERTAEHYARTFFLSQNEKTRYASEVCIDVLRAANIIIGKVRYTWCNHIANYHDFNVNQGNTNHTLILASDIFEPWLASKDQLSQFRSHMRTAARLCVIGSAIFIRHCAGVLKP